MTAGRAAPQSLEAERALLGGLLLDFSQMAAVSELLGVEDFYGAAHARIYQLMLEREAANEQLDVLGLADHIISTGQAEEFGGVSYATGLPERVPSTTNVEYYAGLVKDKAVRRRLMQVGGELHARATSGKGTVEELLQYAEGEVFAVGQGGSKKDWQPLDVVLRDEWAQLEARCDAGGGLHGVTTGYIDLDRQLAGLKPSDLLILAARPAMGKTALALNMATRIAQAGTGVAFFSLEMGAGQLALRILVGESRVDAGKVRTGRLSRAVDWPRLEDGHNQVHDLPLWIEDRPGLSITQVRSKARRLKAQHPALGVIFVDYLQLMTGSAATKGRNREQEISEISRGLKHLAKELELPVVALSQLNRGVESRKDKRPMVSDLRESGAIEQDADIICFIYRDEYYNPETTTEPNVAEVIVAKQRNGPTGTVKLFFEGRFTRFENLDSTPNLYA